MGSYLILDENLLSGVKYICNITQVIIQHVRSLGAAKVIVQNVLQGHEIRQVRTILDIQQCDEELVPDSRLHIPGRNICTLTWVKH